MIHATFPHLAGLRSARFWPEGMALPPEQGITGADTIIPTMRGRWMAQCVFIMHSEAQVLQWQAFLAQMQGFLGTTEVPCFSWFRPRDSRGRMPPFSRSGGIAGAQTFEHFGLDAAPPVRIVAAEATPLRASRMQLRLRDTTGIRPGQYFSVGDRLHQVRTHSGAGDDLRTITFHPPLREAVAAGAAVEVDRPVCRMRFVTETEGLFDQHYANIAPEVTVSFVEDV